MASSTATLAQGSFGKVYKKKYNGQWAAIKKIPCDLFDEKALEREYKVYKEAIHRNIVKILGPVTIENNKYLIPMEFIFGENLETTIFQRKKSKIALTPAVKSTIIAGMCEGLLHLHSRDIVHQDLKPDNIMVERSTNRAVIIDLGLAKFFKNGLSSAADMGNVAYSAPEVLQSGSQRDQRSDVWAMGKIITELHIESRLPTHGVTRKLIIKQMMDFPYLYSEIVCRMVEPDPAKRGCMAGVIGDVRQVHGRGGEHGPESAAFEDTQCLIL